MFSHLSVEMSSTAPSQPACANCFRTADPGTTSLSMCSKCRKAHYCNKECQKAHWKEHKNSCIVERGANITFQTSESTAAAARLKTAFSQSKKAEMEAFIGHSSVKWLHTLPQVKAFAYLIDSYRMRVQDEKVFAGRIDNDSVHGTGDPVVGFRKYLLKAEEHDKVLPIWWIEEKRECCLAKSADAQAWSSVHKAVEKQQIQTHYKDDMMPMKLRMLAEEILGTNVMEL